MLPSLPSHHDFQWGSALVQGLRGRTGKGTASPGPLSRAAALEGELNCSGLHQDPSVGPATAQGRVANGIWNPRELMKRQALEREEPGMSSLTNASEQRERDGWEAPKKGVRLVCGLDLLSKPWAEAHLWFVKVSGSLTRGQSL